MASRIQDFHLALSVGDETVADRRPVQLPSHTFRVGWSKTRQRHRVRPSGFKPETSGLRVRGWMVTWSSFESVTCGYIQS